MSVMQRELDEHLWNNHTLRPVHQSHCLSGKPEAVYHLPHRSGGRECGVKVSQEVLHQFDDILPAQRSLCSDLQVHLMMERQSEIPQPVSWSTAVKNEISLKHMANRDYLLDVDTVSSDTDSQKATLNNL